MNRKFRNWVFKLHTWLGLHLSIFFAFLFLTGTLLVVGLELESIARPAIWTTVNKEDRTASFSTIYQGIKKAHPESDVFNITKRPTPWFADRSTGHTGWGEIVNFWTDPVTGEVVAESRTVGFSSILRNLHDSLLTTKQTVVLVISASSILLFLQMTSGLVTYRRFWKGLFRWPNSSNGPRSWAGGAHRLTAVWAVPLVLLIAVTSFCFFLGELGYADKVPQPKPTAERETALPSDFGPAAIDRAEALARNALPGFEPVEMLIPGRKTESIKFIGHQDGYSELSGSSSVSIDPLTFEILGAFAPDDSRGLARWYTLVEMLHFGTWGGAFSRGLWVLLGFASTAVALTGALVFAARLAPNAAQYGPLRRIWRGLGWSRWIYLLILLGILVAAYLRFGPDSVRKSWIHPVDTPGSVARLILNEPLRRDRPLDVALRLGEPDVEEASVVVNNGDAQQLELTQVREKPQAQFRILPSDTSMEITVRLKKTDNSEQIVNFRLGRPIW
ncbi:PepSY domain-containing protein [Ruegeria sediminis]|uniref:PepSY domain-containing protein n=1 Tax=Ruegeria sediminis TaxID=2583820 RepID=A0ABY2WWB9_9RHOB|nr:PepSY-associated TM helix domain-containing protein [Ruegeria sediminis]TMV07038.1 PepSY domain-containing protein [Ruegeria sediminis]